MKSIIAFLTTLFIFHFLIVFCASSNSSNAFAGNTSSQEVEQIFQKGLQFQFDGSFEKAIQFFKEAATKGHSAAKFALGQLYEEGTGVPKDLKAAVEWYTQAANEGLISAQSHLGSFYEFTESDFNNIELAIKYYRMASEHNDTYSQYKLGEIYERGKGVEVDYEKALKYYLLAADGDEVFAQNALGRMYENGIGVEKNEIEALMWYMIAAENHQERNAIKSRNRLSKTLSKDQIIEAYNRVKKKRLH